MRLILSRARFENMIVRDNDLKIDTCHLIVAYFRKLKISTYSNNFCVPLNLDFVTLAIQENLKFYYTFVHSIWMEWQDYCLFLSVISEFKKYPDIPFLVTEWPLVIFSITFFGFLIYLKWSCQVTNRVENIKMAIWPCCVPKFQIRSPSLLTRNCNKYAKW